MAERPRKSPIPSRQKLKFAPKAPVSKLKKTAARSSTQQEAEKEEYVIDREIVTRLRTRQATAVVVTGTDDDGADQKPQSSSSQADLQSQADNYGPCITLPMRPDNTNSEELNKMEFSQPSRTSAEMESFINTAKDLGLEKESNDQRMLLFKFPPLPLEIPAVNTEETDSKGKKKAKKTGSNLRQLPSGHVGKMLVYKSGKVKMKLGNVIFDVNPGVKYFFHEKAVATNANKKHFCELGSIQQHAVVTPDVDDLLKGAKCRRPIGTPLNTLQIDEASVTI